MNDTSCFIWVVCNKLTTVWAPTKLKLLGSWQFSGPFGVTKYGSGWRKDVVNRCLEFRTSGVSEETPELIEQKLEMRNLVVEFAVRMNCDDVCYSCLLCASPLLINDLCPDSVLVPCPIKHETWPKQTKTCRQQVSTSHRAHEATCKTCQGTGTKPGWLGRCAVMLKSETRMIASVLKQHPNT